MSWLFGNTFLVISTLSLGSVLVFAVSTLTRNKRSLSWVLGGLVSAVTLAAAMVLLFLPRRGWDYMNLDPLALFLDPVALALGIAVAGYSTRYMRESDGAGRYYGLLILMVTGVTGILAAQDTVGLYLYFELMSISSYSLVSFRKEDLSPVDAGLKYLVLNATGSTLALTGIALSYLYTGSTSLGAVGWAIGPQGTGLLSPGGLALALTVAGLGVKSAMVPFHTWLPDAYTYAPAGVSAIMSGIVTEMGFISMLKLTLGEFTRTAQPFGYLLMCMAVVTMTVGNLGALLQKDIKRVLSYSSIAQMGYMMAGMGMGIGFGLVDGVRGSLFHILTHASMKAGAFLAAGLLIDALGTRNIREMQGAGHRYPLVSGVLVLSCLSLAGIPGFAGFMSKWWIYRTGFESGTALGTLVSVTAILNSLCSLGYYLPLIFILFKKQKRATAPPEPSRTPWEIVPVLVLGVAVLVLGVYPTPVLHALDAAALRTMALLGGM